MFEQDYYYSYELTYNHEAENDDTIYNLTIEQCSMDSMNAPENEEDLDRPRKADDEYFYMVSLENNKGQILIDFAKNYFKERENKCYNEAEYYGRQVEFLEELEESLKAK